MGAPPELAGLCFSKALGDRWAPSALRSCAGERAKGSQGASRGLWSDPAARGQITAASVAETQLQGVRAEAEAHGGQRLMDSSQRQSVTIEQ